MPTTWIDESAPVITRDEIVVRASPEQVWHLQTDIASWPTWQSQVERAEPEGPVAEGMTFRWLSSGLDITSTVTHVETGHRLVWGGTAQGITGVHAWTFTSTADGRGTTVRTEESWAGDPVEAHPEELEALLDASLRTWLRELKATAESGSR